MKKALFASTVLALAISATSALAADLPSSKSPPYLPPPPAFSWTGSYMGVNLGGGWLDNYNRSPSWGWNGIAWGWNAGVAVNGSNGGVIGGAQSGYNYQVTPMFVVGFEESFQGTSIGSGNGANLWGWGGSSRSVPWFETVRGRIGVTPFDPHFMIYGTGGFAFGEMQLATGTWNGNLSHIATGWTAGGGLEWAFLPNWSAKVEYLFTNIGANNWGNNWSPEERVRIHAIRVGVNYHYDLFDIIRKLTKN